LDKVVSLYEAMDRAMLDNVRQEVAQQPEGEPTPSTFSRIIESRLTEEASVWMEKW
jgi:hypothetical protein